MTAEELKKTHWQMLKKMMADAGLEFKSKEQAIEELSKLQPTPDGTASGDNGESATSADADQGDGAQTKASNEAQGPRFDRKKPYGEICGDVPDAPGARFLQGGHYFNNAGDAVGKA